MGTERRIHWLELDTTRARHPHYHPMTPLSLWGIIIPSCPFKKHWCCSRSCLISFPRSMAAGWTLIITTSSSNSSSLSPSCCHRRPWHQVWLEPAQKVVFLHPSSERTLLIPAPLSMQTAGNVIPVCRTQAGCFVCVCVRGREGWMDGWMESSSEVWNVLRGTSLHSLCWAHCWWHLGGLSFLAVINNVCLSNAVLWRVAEDVSFKDGKRNISGFPPLRTVSSSSGDLLASTVKTALLALT